jgi:hypothetical protein
VRNPPLLDGVLQRAGDVLLPDDVGEALWPVFACQDLVSHREVRFYQLSLVGFHLSVASRKINAVQSARVLIRSRFHPGKLATRNSFSPCIPPPTGLHLRRSGLQEVWYDSEAEHAPD